MPPVTYPVDIRTALDAFKALRASWEGVRDAGWFLKAEARADLVRMLGAARDTCGAAEPHVIKIRGSLRNATSYEARRATCDVVAPSSRRAKATQNWDLERQILENCVPLGTLDGYLRHAKRKVFKDSRLASLPAPAPFTGDRPLRDQASMLYVPTQTEASYIRPKRVQSQLRIIDSILIILGNTYEQANELRFDISYTLGVGVAISA